MLPGLEWAWASQEETAGRAWKPSHPTLPSYRKEQRETVIQGHMGRSGPSCDQPWFLASAAMGVVAPVRVRLRCVLPMDFRNMAPTPLQLLNNIPPLIYMKTKEASGK
jgi:hypothetical protein